MIPVVEDFIVSILKARFNWLGDNPEHIDKILKMSKERREKLKEFIACKELTVKKGYPRTPNQLPTVAVLLSSENERQDGFGDWGGDDGEVIDLMEEVQPVIYREGAYYPYPYVVTDRKALKSINSVYNLTKDKEIPMRDVFLLMPTLGHIALPVGHIDDGDEIQLNYTYGVSATEDLRTLYEANFRVEVWTNNADLTVELYHIIKWAMLESRDELSYMMGLFNQKLGGSDYSPVPSYFPEFVYRRALQFWCEFNASIPLREVPYIETVESTLHIEDFIDLEQGTDISTNSP